MASPIPDVVISTLEYIWMNLIMPTSFDDVLDLVDEIDPDASVWLEEHPDQYEKALNIARMG